MDAKHIMLFVEVRNASGEFTEQHLVSKARLVVIEPPLYRTRSHVY